VVRLGEPLIILVAMWEQFDLNRWLARTRYGNEQDTNASGT
jgi:hypothetical protein